MTNVVFHQTEPKKVTDQEWRWLLKDKYHWSEGQILEFLARLSQAGGEVKNLPVTPEILTDIDRLQAGEPLQYVIGWVSFLDCQIDLSFRPLIPRPETEDWVGKVRVELAGEITQGKLRPDFSLLDLCCGSGCIGLACMDFFPQARVTFVDISERAIAQTKMNIVRKFSAQEMTQRTQIIQSDLFAQLSGESKFEVIMCNPPYVNPAEIHDNSLSFEPSEALFAEQQGLEVLWQVIEQCHDFLLPQGHVYLEFGQGQEVLIEKILNECQFFERTFFSDQFKVIRGVKFKKHC